MRTLLVEDDPAIAEFIARGLREAGFAVDHAVDGDAGLDLAVRGSYDVAIVDVMLPRLDGLALIDALNEDPAVDGILVRRRSCAWTAGRRR